MPRPKSQAPAGASSIAVAAVAALSWSAAPAMAEVVRPVVAAARATIVDAATLKGVAQVSQTRPGLARPALQVTIRPEPIPGDPAVSKRRELVVVFD